MTTPPPCALDNVYWLGGGSGTGKSTIARRLAEGFGLELLSTDDLMAAHAEESAAAEAPLLDRFKRMSMDERWLHRSPQAMLDTFHWFHGRRSISSYATCEDFRSRSGCSPKASDCFPNASTIRVK